METACSSALVANHAALSALERDECESALVTAVMLMLLPTVSWACAVASLTSALGRSLSFDKRADGYVRGEACGALVLAGDGAGDEAAGPGRPRPLSSCVKQSGRSASLTAPNGSAQQQLMRAGLQQAAIPLEEIACLEAAANGSPLGDPIEAGSIRATQAARPSGGRPLVVGTVKANLGHGETASGVTGLVRLAIGLGGGHAPPNAQLRVLNAHVASALQGGTSWALPSQLTHLSGGGGGGRGGGGGAPRAAAPSTRLGTAGSSRTSCSRWRAAGTSCRRPRRPRTPASAFPGARRWSRRPRPRRVRGQVRGRSRWRSRARR